MQLYDTVAVCVGSDVVGIAHILSEENYTIVPLWPFSQTGTNFFVPDDDAQKRLVIDSTFPLVGGGTTLKRFYKTPWGAYFGGILRYPRRRESNRYDPDSVAVLRPVQPGDSTQVALYKERIDLARAEKEAPQIKAQAEMRDWVRKNPILALTGLPPWKVRMILKIVER